MGEWARTRLTYANVLVTLLAFVVLCGGVAWALEKNSVGAKQIKRDAVRGAEVKDDKLTGADIDESSLGEVPSARSAVAADTANSAASASDSLRLAGRQIAPLAFQAPRATDTTLIGEVGPLRIYATCVSNGVVSVSASSSQGGTLKYAVKGATQSNYSGLTLTNSPAEFVSAASLFDRSPAIFTYRVGGRLINGQFMLANSPAAPEPCLVSGLVSG